MSQPWAGLIAYLIATVVVAAVWALASALTMRGGTVDDFVEFWPMITLLVASVGALPVFVLRLWVKARSWASFRTSLIAGAMLGATAFVLFFVNWSGSDLWARSKLILYGGGLGLLGGGTYWVTERRLLQVGTRVERT